MESSKTYHRVAAFKITALGNIVALLNEGVPSPALIAALESLASVLRHGMPAAEEDERTSAAELPPIKEEAREPRAPDVAEAIKKWGQQVTLMSYRVRKNRTQAQTKATFESFARKWGTGQVSLLWDAFAWGASDIADFSEGDRNLLHAAAALWGLRSW